MKRGKLRRIQINDPSAFAGGVNDQSGCWKSPPVPAGKVWKIESGSMQSVMSAAAGTRFFTMAVVDQGGTVQSAVSYGTAANEQRTVVFAGSAGTNPPGNSFSQMSQAYRQPLMFGGQRLQMFAQNVFAGDQLSQVIINVWECEEEDLDVVAIISVHP